MTRVRIFFPLFFLCVTAIHAAELRNITLGLVSPNLSTQLPIVVGQQVGFFKDEGLNVHSVTIASGGTLMVAILTSGHADLVVSGVAAIMRAIDRGAPVTVVSGFQNRIDFALIGAKGIRRLETKPSASRALEVSRSSQFSSSLKRRGQLTLGIGPV
jgi:ABC-type nitrate/sulfonate/bicarbonate transport system substrate-binding protein